MDQFISAADPPDPVTVQTGPGDGVIYFATFFFLLVSAMSTWSFIDTLRELLDGTSDVGTKVVGLVLFGTIILATPALLVRIFFFRIWNVSVGSTGVTYQKGLKERTVPWQSISRIDLVTEHLGSLPGRGEPDIKYRTTIRIQGTLTEFPQHFSIPRARGAAASDEYAHALRFIDQSKSSAMQYTSTSGVAYFTSTEVVAMAIARYGGDRFCGLHDRTTVPVGVPQELVGGRADPYVDDPREPQDASDDLKDPVRLVVGGPGCIWASLISASFLISSLAWNWFVRSRLSTATAAAQQSSNIDLIIGVVTALIGLLLLTVYIFGPRKTRTRLLELGSLDICYGDKTSRLLAHWEEISSVDVLMAMSRSSSPDYQTQIRLAFVSAAALRPDLDRFRTNGPPPYSHCIVIDMDVRETVERALAQYSGGRFAGVHAPQSYWQKVQALDEGKRQAASRRFRRAERRSRH